MISIENGILLLRITFRIEHTLLELQDESQRESRREQIQSSLDSACAKEL